MSGNAERDEPEYVALVRNYHPQGYAEGWYAGCVKRKGGKRMTGICQHRHATHVEAQACADNLAAQRNGHVIPPAEGQDR